MKSYLLCLDKQYEIELCEDGCTSTMCFNYDTMLDNLIYLLQSYGVSEEEILETIKEDTTIKIKEVE